MTNTTKPTDEQEGALNGMMNDILDGLFEDFAWQSKEQAEAILTSLKARVNKITVEEIVDEDPE